MKQPRLGILGSGKGTNCRAILEAIHSGELDAEARIVISDVFDAPILDIAREFSVPNIYLPPGHNCPRRHGSFRRRFGQNCRRWRNHAGLFLLLRSGRRRHRLLSHYLSR